jgi:hypothetical protein
LRSTKFILIFHLTQVNLLSQMPSALEGPQGAEEAVVVILEAIPEVILEAILEAILGAILEDPEAKEAKEVTEDMGVPEMRGGAYSRKLKVNSTPALD